MTLDEAYIVLKEEIENGWRARLEAQKETGLAAFEQRIVLEQRVRMRIDTACEEFASSQAWPQLEPDLARFVWDRLVQARECAVSLLQSEFGEAEGEWLQWLLVEYWYLAGCSRWHTQRYLFSGE